MFKKIDSFFRHVCSLSYIAQLEQEREFLVRLKERSMSVDDAIADIDRRLKEVKTCNIIA